MTAADCRGDSVGRAIISFNQGRGGIPLRDADLFLIDGSSAKIRRPIRRQRSQIPLFAGDGAARDALRRADSALDPEMIVEVLDVMISLAQEGMTMVVVTHQMGFARKVADRVVFMDKGRSIEDRRKAEFFVAPQSDRAKIFLSKILGH